ncbi:MAG: carboxymuconolactone decarboxylase family protein [Acidimicrobiales bacterium]
MARIQPLPPDDAKQAAVDAGLPEFVADLNVFRVWLRHPGIAKGINGLLGRLLLDGRLDARLRELIIMRLGWSTGSDYEWTQHWRISEQLAIPAEDLLAVREWESSDRFGEPERAVLAATDEVVRDGAVGPATWGALVEHVSDDPVILLEVVHVIGLWRMVSSALRSLEVPLEDGVSSWPPDGRAP